MALQMPYWSRIAVGALFGVIAILALWPTLGITWLTALVAALVAPIAFLGSYFIISADRPDIGYEQVLFDKPNTIVTIAMLVVFAGAGVGTGFLGGGAAEPMTPADHVFALKSDYQATYDGWTADADKDATLARLDELRAESDRIEKFDLATLAEGDERKLLAMANDALAFAIDELRDCARADTRSCLDARLKGADADIALQKWVALGEAPADDTAAPAADAPEA